MNITKNKILLLLSLPIILILLYIFKPDVVPPKNRNNFTLITHGYEGCYPGIDCSQEHSRAKAIVARKWGITFELGGCVYDKDKWQEDKKNSNEAERNIENKFGNDWKAKFNKEVEILAKKNN